MSADIKEAVYAVTWSSVEPVNKVLFSLVRLHLKLSQIHKKVQIWAQKCELGKMWEFEMFQPIDSVSLTRRLLSDATIIRNTARAHHRHLRAGGAAEPDALTSYREQIRRGLGKRSAELQDQLVLLNSSFGRKYSPIGCWGILFLNCKTRRRRYLSD